jgi:acyl carrier protein
MEAPSRPSRPRILAEIRAFVAEWFRDGRDEGLEPETPLVTSGIVDSAGVLELVEFLERRFGIKVQEADLTLRNCNTLAALTELVAQRL